MKHFLPLTLGPLTLGAVLLAACSAANPGGERPPLPSGIEVRFPAAPANAFLSLLDESGKTVYQLAVPAGKTSIGVDAAGWATTTQEASATDPKTYAPQDALLHVSSADLKIVLLHWVMWQDKNTNGQLDSGEQLDLMTHDRVTYANQTGDVHFTAGNMYQSWKFTQGWSRAEHYVYLPKNSATYQRSLTSSGLERYELHVSTPVTSQ